MGACYFKRKGVCWSLVRILTNAYTYMGNFNRDSRPSGDRGGKSFVKKDFGGRSFGGGGRSFSGNGGAPRAMFQATCGQCGQSCEVPFKPTGERPVFCRNCFRSQGAPSPRFAPVKSFGGSSGNFGGNSGGNASVTSGSVISKGQLDALNAKLDKILALLTVPSIEKEAPKANVLEVEIKKSVAKKTKSLGKKAIGKKK
ncbi:MAG: hypothetical protein EXS55_02450 [Candidatus Magasanikbacteria bacterium]|nr:hypothetical protein [Candidatus Magasanikbacteria bacterium]